MGGDAYALGRSNASDVSDIDRDALMNHALFVSKSNTLLRPAGGENPRAVDDILGPHALREGIDRETIEKLRVACTAADRDARAYESYYADADEDDETIEGVHAWRAGLAAAGDDEYGSDETAERRSTHVCRVRGNQN